MAEDLIMTDSTIAASSSQMSGAPNYNRWTYEQFSPLLTGDVLEVGCGVGNFSQLLHECRSIERLLSVDVSEEAIALCQQKFPRQRDWFRCMDFRELDEPFDTILCMNVLEHIEDDHGATARLIELLKPGGKLFLLVPAHQQLFNPWDTEVGHYRRYSKRSFRRLLAEINVLHSLRRQYYFNSVGALGYFFVYRLMGKKPAPETPAELRFFDRCIVPLQKRIEGSWLPFGLSLINIIEKHLHERETND